MFGMHRNRINPKSGDKSKKRISFQRCCQLVSAVLVNGYVVGFQKGTIFTGKSKAICVPGGDWRQKASFSFLCIGDADAVWNCAGAAGLRFAVPVWSGTGFAVSDSNTESASTQKD